MPVKSKKIKFTTAQIKDHIRSIQKAIEKHKRENKGEHFTAITPEEIEKKLKRVNSPMIFWESWNDTTPGGTCTYTLAIFNPDPTAAISLYGHVWVGSGNVDPIVGTFLTNVDTRFHRLTQPAAPGLSIATGATATLSFNIKVPTTIEKTSYIGNSCLMKFGFDIGTYLDRGVFVFTVS